MGTKTGKPRGRPKGSCNKTPNVGIVLARRGAISPLEFMLQVMDDEDASPSVRMDAAKSAAPYVHARLQSVTTTEKPYEGDPNAITNEYLASIIARGGSSNDDATKKGKGKPH